MDPVIEAFWVVDRFFERGAPGKVLDAWIVIGAALFKDKVYGQNLTGHQQPQPKTLRDCRNCRRGPINSKDCSTSECNGGPDYLDWQPLNASGVR